MTSLTEPANAQKEKYSFGAQEIEVDKEAIEENQGVDDRLVHLRWRCFTRNWIEETKGDSLDISWLKDKDSVDAADLPEPEMLARRQRRIESSSK